MTAVLTKMATQVDLDTDAISPDCLKVSFEVAIDALISRAEQHTVAVDWNSIEVALHRRSAADSQLVVRAGVLRG